MNKYFNKQTVMSFILGGIVFSSVGIFAATELSILPNPYPIVVNGEKADVEGYNIEGRTYLQLRDMTEVLDTTLNFKDNTIFIDSNININNDSEMNLTPSPIITITPKPTPTVSTDVNINTNNESEVDDLKKLDTTLLEQKKNKPESTPDGITKIDIDNGKYYIGIALIQHQIENKGYKLICDSNKVYKLIKDDNILLDNVEYMLLSKYGYDVIEYNYYVNNILPLIQKEDI